MGAMRNSLRNGLRFAKTSPGITAVSAIILALGKPLLALFGTSFEQGYPVMFILAVGMLSRPAVGPALSRPPSACPPQWI